MAHLALSARGTIALTGAERPVPVTGNAAAIADALRNIIENSLAHTAPGTDRNCRGRSAGGDHGSATRQRCLREALCG